MDNYGNECNLWIIPLSIMLLIIYDFRLKDTYKIDGNSTSYANEIASDEIITDMDFSPKKWGILM